MAPVSYLSPTTLSGHLYGVISSGAAEGSIHNNPIEVNIGLQTAAADHAGDAHPSGADVGPNALCWTLKIEDLLAKLQYNYDDSSAFDSEVIDNLDQSPYPFKPIEFGGASEDQTAMNVLFPFVAVKKTPDVQVVTMAFRDVVTRGGTPESLLLINNIGRTNAAQQTLIDAVAQLQVNVDSAVQVAAAAPPGEAAAAQEALAAAIATRDLAEVALQAQSFLESGGTCGAIDTIEDVSSTHDDVQTAWATLSVTEIIDAGASNYPAGLTAGTNELQFKVSLYDVQGSASAPNSAGNYTTDLYNKIEATGPTADGVRANLQSVAGQYQDVQIKAGFNHLNPEVMAALDERQFVQPEVLGAPSSDDVEDDATFNTIELVATWVTPPQITSLVLDAQTVTNIVFRCTDVTGEGLTVGLGTPSMDDMMVQIKRQIHTAVTESGSGNLHGLIGGMSTAEGGTLGAMSKTTIVQSLPITPGNDHVEPGLGTAVNFSKAYTNVVQFVRNYATLGEWVAAVPGMEDPHQVA